MQKLTIILSLLFILLSCEKESLVVENTTPSPAVSIEKAGGDCIFDASEQQFYDFEVCGVAFTTHITFDLFNFNDFHYIQAVVRTYKRGGDPTHIADLADITMYVGGGFHILCEEQQLAHKMSDYLTGGLPGEVGNTYECEDCGYGVVTLSYSKDVSLVGNDELKLYTSFKVEGCGEMINEEFLLYLEP